MPEDADLQSFFDGFAAEYAGFAEAPLRAEYEWPAVESLLPDLSDERVLDVACGPGDTSALLADRGAAVLGVDASAGMVRVAEERHGDVASFRQGDLRDGLPFLADDSRDLVVSQLTLGHVADWGQVFESFDRVLDSDGTVVLSLSHPFTEYLMLRADGFPAFGGLFRGGDEPSVELADEEEVRYADRQRFEGEWGSDGGSDAVGFLRRPLAGVFEPLLDAGFVVTGVEEPTPTEGLRETEPELAADLARRPPIFLCLRAEKR